MAYGTDLSGAARRHLQAAKELVAARSGGTKSGCRAVAGYLFGLAGELALKAMMWDSGMKRLPPADHRDDPYYAHFPELKTLLQNAAEGRRSRELRALAENSSLFQYWDTKMRYAPTTDIKPSWVESWQKSAEELVDRIGL